MDYNRREEIQQMLIDYGVVYYKELCEIYKDVSEMTIRRDIDFLVSINKATKIMGGARINKEQGILEEIYTSRYMENQDEKIAIANKALSYIRPQIAIYLDAGTTVMALARLLPDINLSILTGGANIALEVIKRTYPIVNIVGGLINKNNISITGSYARAMIKNINIDTVFMGTSGYTKNEGFTCGNLEEQKLKTAIIKKARKVIILMDSSKQGKILPFTFAKPKDVDILITNRNKKTELMKPSSEMEIILVE